MSQRRGGGTAQGEAGVLKEEMVPFSEVLDKPSGGQTMDREDGGAGDVEQPAAQTPSSGSNNNATPVPAGSMSLDSRYEAEAQNIRLKQWKEGPFATGMTDTTWDKEYARYRKSPREACMDMDDDMPCLCCSALVCGYLGAARVGNMAGETVCFCRTLKC